METIVISDTETAVVSQDANQQTIAVSDTETIVVSQDTGYVVVTGIMGPPGLPGPSSLSDLSDIDKTQLVNGATLVYNANSAVWKATNKLDNQILEAGQF
jgi:hypothetical protein